MQQPLHIGVSTATAPRFYITGRQPLNPGAILIAIVAAIGALSSVLYVLSHNGHARLINSSGAARSANPTSKAASTDDEKDDPSQIDTIVLGDPADAPVPARPGDHVSPVHPTILVRLPHFGDQVGLIPDTPPVVSSTAGLRPSTRQAIPRLATLCPMSRSPPQPLHRSSYGSRPAASTLLSAKEVQPGVLVFRLRNQTCSAIESLGILQVRPDSSPAAIASFSLRAVPPQRHDAATGAGPFSAASPR